MLNFFTLQNNISFLGSEKLYDGNINTDDREKPKRFLKLHDIRSDRKRVTKFTMNEDYFARSRNGHLLKDTFDKKTNTLDIYSSGLYPANVLSNLALKPFVFDDVECSSIEGFLQSLKVEDSDVQKEICKLYGGSARKQSKKHTSWMAGQRLFWQGREYKRDSEEYFDLLYRVFKACYDQNPTFRNALDYTKGMNLSHSSGKSNANDTVITSDEFIAILLKLRDEET